MNAAATIAEYSWNNQMVRTATFLIPHLQTLSKTEPRPIASTFINNHA
jgi:hypothetical protein